MTFGSQPIQLGSSGAALKLTKNTMVDALDLRILSLIYVQAESSERDALLRWMFD